MAYRIRIEIPGGTLYPAMANEPTFLTFKKAEARRYRSASNADAEIPKWDKTLSKLGFVDQVIWAEDADE